MPLPQGNQPWPPKDWTSVYADYRVYASWYAGNVDDLLAIHSGTGSYWGRVGRMPSSQQPRLHVPMAADLSATSATLLFAEEPEIVIPEAREAKPKEDGGKQDVPSDAKQADARLQEIIQQGDIHSRLIEAAETASAFGGVFLKVDWDTGFAEFPILSVVQPDNALPEFKYGFLNAVTLWRVLPSQNNSQTVWRHIERHEEQEPENGVFRPINDVPRKGRILHGLYEGTTDRLGTRRELSAHPETAGLQDVVNLPFDGIAVRYIPNLLPNRRYRGSSLGRSDYDGAESLFDALDEAYASWMRDIRLAKARLLVPESWLKVDSATGELGFDTENEIYAPLELPGTAEVNITASQFAIRFEEHERTILHLVMQIVTHAGYAPQSFGLTGDGSEVTATQVRARERRTLMTQQLKRRSWEQSIADLLENMLILDRVMLGKPTPTDYRPKVTMADSLTPDTMELATTAELLQRAGAASTDTLVRLVNPGKSEEEIVAEVQRITEERGLALPAELEGVPLA